MLEGGTAPGVNRPQSRSVAYFEGVFCIKNTDYCDNAFQVNVVKPTNSGSHLAVGARKTLLLGKTKMGIRFGCQRSLW